MHTRRTRRDILKLSASATASALLLPAFGLRARAWKNIPIGTQLWCVRQQLAADIPGTLNALSAIGFFLSGLLGVWLLWGVIRSGRL